MRRKISIIIPVYNASECLDRCLLSVMDQTDASFEAILVDDGSTDDSPAICDRYASEDERFRVIHKENGGVSSARNAGLDAATGSYIMFLDADDVLSHDALEILSTKDCDLAVGGFRKVVCGKTDYCRIPKYDKVYIGPDQICSFLDDNIGKKDCYMLNSSCFKLYRRSLLEENALRFDEQLKYGEDKLFVFTYLKYVNSVRTLNEVIYDYVYVDDSLSFDTRSDSHLNQVMLLLKSYVPLLEELKKRYTHSRRLDDLYHVDVVSRYVFRILTCFATRRTELMTQENISHMYAYMSDDEDLSIFSVRFRQILNVMLFRMGKPRLTRSLYSFSSSICRYIPFR